MTASSAGHHHSAFMVPADYADLADRAVDHELLGRFVSAAVDSCTRCQDALMTLMIDDPATTACLVELTCVSTQDLLGGLPTFLIQDHAPGPTSPEFRQLARTRLSGATTTLLSACEHMTSDQRRYAAHTAVSLLVDNLHLSARLSP